MRRLIKAVAAAMNRNLSVNSPWVFAGLLLQLFTGQSGRFVSADGL
jgi:hypothetical protein